MKKPGFIFFLYPLLTTAQTRNEFWLKAAVNHQFSKHWAAGIELHHRRQANFQSQDKNIFHYPLGNYARAWIQYKLPGEWLLIVSPIGYFSNEDILNSKGELKQTDEVRVSPGIIKSFTIGKVKNKNRFLYDARFAEFSRPGYFFQSRFRLQSSFTIPVLMLKKENQVSCFISGEVLVKKEKKAAGFDQNRLYNAVQWKNHSCDIDLGYQWIVQKGAGSVFYRNQLFIMFNINI